ncbi:isochorismatase [Lachnospiraceae bacterium KM106-2]|nr:isochorismatase [Lachnospiraceae bacterium KM106-2]
MKKTALLIIDMQQDLIDNNPYMINSVISNINELKSFCEKQQIEIIYIRHNDNPGEPLSPNQPGWEITGSVSPSNSERIFDKHYNSAFLHTGLKDYLDSKQISSLIITGLQTEYCVDATIKAAFELGYNIYIPKATNSSFSNRYLTAKDLVEYYNYMVWDKRFATVISIKELIKQFS